MAIDLVSQQLSRIENEENFTLKLFMLIDVYEYCLKLLAVHQLQCFVRDIETSKMKTKAFKNICNVFLASFQRPSFGHWISLLRNAAVASAADKPLKRVLLSADIVVVQRNKLAHGVTPAIADAKAIYEKLRPLLTEIEIYIQCHDVLKSIGHNITLTPFVNTIHELYNGLRKDRVEFLNYDDGQITELPVWNDFDLFYKNYFDLKAHISHSQVLVLLSDYFLRDYWEHKLEACIREHQVTFLYGYAGVGKTIMSARISQIVNSGFYRFSSANRNTASARHAFLQFYHSFRGEIGGLANIAPSTSPDDLRYYLGDLSVKLTGSRYFFVFDGLDEISEDEFEEFLSYLAIFIKSGVNFLISARNYALKQSIAKVDATLAVVKLENMTELEVKEWLKKHSARVRYPSIEVIKAIYGFSQGNFLFLANLKKDLGEQDYLAAIKDTPAGVDAIFENMTEDFSSESLATILLLVVIPGSVSQNLICAYLDVDNAEFKKIKQQILTVIKELDDNNFELFHDRYTYFLKTQYSSGINAAYQNVFNNISRLQGYIKPLESISDMYVEQKNFDGLFAGCKTMVSEGHQHALFIDDRYAYVTAMTTALSILLQTDAERFRSTLTVLDEFISCNFQLLFDWKFSAHLCKALNAYKHIIDINRYQYVDLMYSCHLHISGDYKSCLKELNQLNSSDSLIAVNRLRCLDYIGLTYGKMGQHEDAINTFTEVIERATDDPNNIWVGYARMNRGKVYSACGQDALAAEDYHSAVAIRDFIANDETGLQNCLADMGNKTQARLTLAMGYENQLKFYMQKQPDVALSVRYAGLLTDVILTTYKQRQQETISFMFTCRMLLSLVEYYQYDRIQCEPVREILIEVYVPKQEAERFNRVMSVLSDNPEINPLTDFIRQFECLWQAYGDGDKESRKVQRQRFKALKAQLLSRFDIVSAFIVSYGKLLDMDEDELEEDFTIKSLGKIFAGQG